MPWLVIEFQSTHIQKVLDRMEQISIAVENLPDQEGTDTHIFLQVTQDRIRVMLIT